jgi:two-component system, OmpR family, sensor histidine kinase CiaH
VKEYKKALWRLTLGYVLAIFVAGMVFTLPVVIVAGQRIDQRVRFLARSGTDPSGSLRFQREGSDVRARIHVHPGGQAPPAAFRVFFPGEDRRMLLLPILAVNGFLLISLGSVASYLFARKTLKPLEAAHRAQERFTADAGHELRTPLAVLQTELEVALRSGKDKPQLEETIRGSIDEVRKLSLLTDSLLQLTKADSYVAAKENVGSVNLSAVVAEAISKMERNRDIRIDGKIQPGVKVEANESLLRQLIEIVLDNAVKYSKDTPEITVVLAAGGQGTRVEVIDWGIGIGREDLPHVFDRLYRGANVGERAGHGLGLALAKSISDIHGWGLQVGSELGKGTKTSLLIPQ